uniref:Uncharacterized protein n=1 Tax=Octactis speculum TaxID=3111310 RepID=A0A7S2FVU0_9STRA
MVEEVNATGFDALGSYNLVTQKWSRSEDEEKDQVLWTSIKTYQDEFLVFEQYFPQALGTAEVGGLSARSMFPAFSTQPAGPAGDCFAYHSVFPEIISCTLDTYVESNQGGTPFVLYDSEDPTLPMMVLSPLSNPKAQHMATSPGVLGAGLKATATGVPKGFSQLFLLSASNGIRNGMDVWGERLRKVTGRLKTDKYVDVLHSSIGFWTDNGGYYHYSTGNGSSTDGTYDRTYEEVLPEVKAYHDDIGVPFRHWQFDSWFYPKDAPIIQSGGRGGAVTNWTSLDEVFPSGMAAIQEKIGLPTVMHNRQWSTTSDYIKNLGYQWYTCDDPNEPGPAAVPVDPTAFFTYFFQQQKDWGLGMYEQDWMCDEYDDIEQLKTNLTLADMWLEGMAAGADAAGLPIQYCMPYPHDVLKAAWLPAVTNIRASGDYHNSMRQPYIGGTALLYDALGVLPFKDGFYSSTNLQVGGQNEGPETQPDLHALMATLSTAMVGPMDGINLLNATRVMTTCRLDGLVLKPDRPQKTVDTCFMKGQVDKPENCFVYSTESAVEGLPAPVFYFFDNAPALSQGLIPEMLELTAAEVSGKFVVLDWYSGAVVPWTDGSVPLALRPGYEGHAYQVVSPVLNFGGAGGGIAFLGEYTFKYVPCSTLRFTHLEVTENQPQFKVTVVGTPNETVQVCAAAEADDWAVVCKSAVFDSKGGTAEVTLP